MSPFERILRELLSEGHGARFRVTGDSMHPTIGSGELVEIEPCRPSDLHRGDLVLAALDRGLTLHRLREVRPDGLIMRGDNAVCDDGLVPLTSLLGRARSNGNITNSWIFALKSLKITRFVTNLTRWLR